ncbi:hypothetical protein AZE42_14203 [Rhizopogon vesiculosus]|uniref:Uncharacterized protein n=1 Tax=Rhizopogon vesiculosus TaxID=180088 RepID=A0A1J8R411_9AGAM|nr:hypothetical protein AZE42_14203 [Rhizopogon vesiculosus]
MPQSAPQITEFAGHIDTGATSHMTPHHHWLRNYVPK